MRTNKMIKLRKKKNIDVKLIYHIEYRLFEKLYYENEEGKKNMIMTHDETFFYINFDKLETKMNKNRLVNEKANKNAVIVCKMTF